MRVFLAACTVILAGAGCATSSRPDDPQMHVGSWVCVDDCGPFMLSLDENGRVRADNRHSDCRYEIEYEGADALVTFLRDDSSDSITLTMRFVSPACMLLLPAQPRESDPPVVCRRMQPDTDTTAPADDDCSSDVFTRPTTA